MWDKRMGALKPWLRPWLPAIGWAVLLAVLSSIPGTAIPAGPTPNFDKLVHGGLYLVLGFFCARALAATTTLAPGALVAAATLMGTLYGVTDELHQLLTPRRSSDWHDVVADAVGALAGALVATRLRRTHRHESDRA
jgi:VanZ family protein